MPTDMEEAVRRSLRLRAAGVTPDPGTWRRVQQRIRRRRALGWAAGGVVVATVAVIATVALPALNGRQVRFVPPVVGRPAPTPSMAPDPTPAAGSLGGECRPQDRLALVAATSDGELVASCASGEEHPVVTDTLESEPAFSPDGTLLAFTRRPAADAPGRVVLLDLDSGEETDLGAGYGPAFGPDGQLAWLVDQPGQLTVGAERWSVAGAEVRLLAAVQVEQDHAPWRVGRRASGEGQQGAVGRERRLRLEGVCDDRVLLAAGARRHQLAVGGGRHQRQPILWAAFAAQRACGRSRVRCHGRRRGGPADDRWNEAHLAAVQRRQGHGGDDGDGCDHYAAGGPSQRAAAADALLHAAPRPWVWRHTGGSQPQ